MTNTTTTAPETIAQNVFFGHKWEELQKRLQAVLSAAHESATVDGNQARYDEAVREAAEMLASMEQLQPGPANIGWAASGE